MRAPDARHLRTFVTKSNDNSGLKKIIIFGYNLDLLMANVSKQIDYWKTSAHDDLATAKILVAKNRLLHGLFFCHLAIEKAIKAHVIKHTKEAAPRSHNLIFLSEIAKLALNDSDESLIGILMKYQLQGRYPDYNPNIPDRTKVNDYLISTEKLMLWLIKQL